MFYRASDSVLPVTLDTMFQNTSFAKFKERFFLKKSKLNKSKSANDAEAEDQQQRPRSSSICSIKVPASEDLVEESLAKGLPIIPFGFPTFVIDEEDPKKKENQQRISQKINEKIIRKQNDQRLEDKKELCSNDKEVGLRE